MAGTQKTTEAKEAATTPLELTKMADAGNGATGAKWWVQAIQTLGVSTAAFFLLGFWANRTIEWEREKFLPALERGNSVMQANSDALKDNTQTMQAVKTTLERLDKKQ